MLSLKKKLEEDMYPFTIFADVDLYTCLVALAVLCALFTLRVLTTKYDISVKLYNFTLVCGTLSIMVGFLSASFFQALYNIKELGRFELANTTGMTFLGGLLGGAFVFLSIYFGVGAFLFKDGENIKSFGNIANIGACCICIAHSIGRIGCLMAGCCHGKRADGFFGIYNHVVGYKTLPVQLYEAIFLIVLFVILLKLLEKGKNTISIYLIAYAIWRFFAEYLRADDRGQTLIDILTPSQLICIPMLALGVLILILSKKGYKNENKTE